MQKLLVPALTISNNKSEIFCLRYSPDGAYLAAGCGDGSIKVFQSGTGAESKVLNTDNISKLPLTSLRFRPEGSEAKTKNVLLAVTSEGTVEHWHLTSGKRLHIVREEDNQLFCVDYRPDGSQFVTAGKDYKVRIYDESTKSVVSVLSGGLGSSTPGHSNRVFSLKYNPDDPNIVISGGWDNTVQIWDIRMEHPVRHVYGPHICGDSVDLRGGVILTGSWRPDNQIELWDYGTGELISRIPWIQSGFKSDPCLIYAAQFSKTKMNLIAAGGSGSNETKVFDRDNNNSIVGTISGLTRGVFAVDFSPVENSLAVGGGDSSVRIFSIISKET